ncbi:MAG: DUF1559 domain-containing protein [Thermoguttaceae bacterium]
MAIHHHLFAANSRNGRRAVRMLRCAFSKLFLLCCLFVASVLAMSLIWPPIGSGPPTSKGYCLCNLKDIGLALENYRIAHGRYPPAFVADKEGKPMHSWRVLILPYLGEERLFNLYDFSEPWDGPRNRKLADHIPEIFVCPKKTTARTDSTTSYLAVTGPGSAWSMPFKGNATVTDPRIWVAEVARSGVNWMEPRDLALQDAARGVNVKDVLGISSLHADGANVLFTGGFVDFLPSSTKSSCPYQKTGTQKGI